MATRSTIAIKHDDGTIRVIYCHWDGYPSNNGRILLEHYNTPEKINALLDLGAVSILAPSMQCPAGHTFDTQKDGYTVFYIRDRGESEAVCKAAVLPNEKEYNKTGEEYNYLFKNGKWTVKGNEFARRVVLTAKHCKK